MSKLNFREFINNFDYYKYQRITKSKSTNGKPYFMYWLCDKLNDEQKKELLMYSNVKLLKSRSQYAQEQITQVIAIYD